MQLSMPYALEMQVRQAFLPTDPTVNPSCSEAHSSQALQARPMDSLLQCILEHTHNLLLFGTQFIFICPSKLFQRLQTLLVNLVPE